MTLQKIVDGIRGFLKSGEIQKYGEESVENFAAIIVGKDPISCGKQVVSTGKLLFSIPDILFWDKMQRFLLGAYADLEMQTKMCAKFDSDDEQKKFVKRQISIVNELDDDDKVDYFAKLTQSVLLNLIDIPLYFKLSKILQSVTGEELKYLSNNIECSEFPNNIFMDSLSQHRLVVKTELSVGFLAGFGENLSDRYSFTQLARCIDKFSINFRNEKYSYSDDMVELKSLSTLGLCQIKNIEQNGIIPRIESI